MIPMLPINTNHIRPNLYFRNFCICPRIHSLLFIRTLDQNLDSLAFLDTLESLFCLLEVDSAGDQLLHVHLSISDQLHSQLVVTATISEAALSSDLIHAKSHDREVDVGLAHSSLDIDTSSADGMDRGLNGWLSTRSIDDSVGASWNAGLLEEVGGILSGWNTCWDEGVCGSEFGSKLESALLDVDGDYLAGTICLSNGTAEETDRASTHDNNSLARLDFSLLDNVNSDSKGLNESAFLERNVVGELVAEVLRGGVESSQGTVDWWSSSEVHISAEVIVAAQAGLASSAGVTRLKGDSVTDLKGLDSRADLNNGTSRFVA